MPVSASVSRYLLNLFNSIVSFLCIILTRWYWNKGAFIEGFKMLHFYALIVLKILRFFEEKKFSTWLIIISSFCVDQKKKVSIMQK